LLFISAVREVLPSVELADLRRSIRWPGNPPLSEIFNHGQDTRPLALVTGASDRHRLRIGRNAAHKMASTWRSPPTKPQIMQAAGEFRALGLRSSVEADLATLEGGRQVHTAAKRMNRPV